MGNSQGRIVSEQDFISLETSGDEWVKSQNAKIAKEEAKIVADAISQPKNKRKTKEAVDLVNRLLAGYQQRCAALEPVVKKSIDKVAEIRKTLSEASKGAIVRQEIEDLNKKLDSDIHQAYLRAAEGVPILQSHNRRGTIAVFSRYGLPHKSVSDYRQSVNTPLEFYKRILVNSPKSTLELPMIDYSSDLRDFMPLLHGSLRNLFRAIETLEYTIPRCGIAIERIIEEGSEAPPEKYPSSLDLPAGLMVDGDDIDSVRRAIACIITQSEQDAGNWAGCVIENNSALYGELIREGLYQAIADGGISDLGRNYVRFRDEALRLINEYQRGYELYFNSLERSSTEINKLLTRRNEKVEEIKSIPSVSLADLESNRQRYEKFMKKDIEQYNRTVERWARMEYLSRMLAGLSSGSPGFDPSAVQLDQTIMSKQMETDPFKHQDRALPISGSGEGASTAAAVLVVALLVVMMIGLIYYMVQLMAAAIAVAAGHSEKEAPPFWCSAVALSVFVVGAAGAGLVMRWRSRARTASP